MARSTAEVRTDRPARYGKQLCSHLGRKAEATWDEDTSRGRIVFDGGKAACDLDCTEGALRLVVGASRWKIADFEDVVGRHLVRFGAKDELECAWVRQNGKPGTTQRSSD